MDGATMEGAMVDEPSDAGGPRRESGLVTRFRSDGAFAEAASLDGRGSSERSTPASSCVRGKISCFWLRYIIYAYFEKEIIDGIRI